MKPVFTCFELDDTHQETLHKALPADTINCYTEPISQELIKKHPETTHLVVFVYSQVTSDILKLLPNLKGIFTMSTGFDHINLDICNERNITVCNVPTYGENTVAEHTFALILSLSRRIYESIRRTEGLQFSADGLEGFDLAEKTLGIVGVGKIGVHVATMAKGFGMNILAYDAYPREGLDAQLGFTYTELDTLLSQSDIVTLHTPYLPETHHLINKKSIQKFKSGAYLINTARGSLVETEAIVHGLRDGILAGAGLDVLEEECALKDPSQILSDSFTANCNLSNVVHSHMLIHDPRVIVTPHNAFNSVEANARIFNTTIQNIQAFLQDKPINTVTNS